MNMYLDKKKNKRLISFLYNSNLLTGISVNENLELNFNPPNNNSQQFIDNRINLAGLDEILSLIYICLSAVDGNNVSSLG